MRNELDLPEVSPEEERSVISERDLLVQVVLKQFSLHFVLINCIIKFINGLGKSIVAEGGAQSQEEITGLHRLDPKRFQLHSVNAP